MLIIANGKRKDGDNPMRTRFFILVLMLFFVLRPFPKVWAQTSGFTSPISGDEVTGVIVIQGTAVHPDFLRYELAFYQQDNPDAQWIVFAEGDQPVSSNTLAVWDTTVGREFAAPVFPDGRYQLRLRVVRTDYNYDEYYVTDVVVQNDGPTPTPTAALDETAVASTITSQSVGGATSDPGSFQQATPIPSLTPFPTPTTRATPMSNSDDSGIDESEANSGGVIGQIESVETNRFSEAFWLGVRLTVAIFLLAALYIIIRQLFRTIRRIIWSRNR